MQNKKEINLSAVEEKIPLAAFGLFRYWLQQIDFANELVIKSEQLLIEDLRKAIQKALLSLKEEDLTFKIWGWEVGFIIGFVKGNLHSHWYQEYVIKRSNTYKQFLGLRAIENYLEFDEVTKLKVNNLYDHLLNKELNILKPKIEVTKQSLEVSTRIIHDTEDKGKILPIINNLILEKILEVSNQISHVDIDLPINDYFSDREILQLIFQNQ